MVNNETKRKNSQLILIVLLPSVLAAALMTVWAPGNPLPLAVAGAVTALVLALRRTTLTLAGASLFLWFVLASHRAFIFRADSVAVGGASFWVAVEVLVTIAIFALSSCLFLYRFCAHQLARVPLTLQLLWVYLVFATMSLLYAPSVTYSAFWLLRLASTVLLLTVYFTSTDARGPVRFGKWTLIAMMPYVLLLWTAFLTGEGVWGDRIRGYWLHPGQASIIGFGSAIGFLLLAVFTSSRFSSLILGLLGVGSAYLAAGKTAAFAAVVVGCIVLLITWRHWISLTGVVAVVLVGVCLVLMASLDVGLVAHWREYQTRGFGTVDARIMLWESALEMWRENPVFGSGFASARVTRISAWEYGYGTGHAHNSYIDSLIGLGLLGSAPLFLAIIVIVGRLLQAPLQSPFGTRYIVPLAASWLVLALSGMGDEVFGGTLQPSAYLFFGLTVCLDVLTERRLLRSAVPAAMVVPSSHVAPPRRALGVDLAS